MPAYPPYQHPFLDAKTRLVTKPWQLFFLRLAGDAGTIADGEVTLTMLAPLSGAPRLLGRGSAGAGPVEELTIGAGLTMTGTELSVDASAIAEDGYWSVITNGDPLSPELLFDSNGDAIMGWVPTP